MVFFTIFELPGAPTSDKMAPKLRRDAFRMEFGRWSDISRPSWTVLASILEGLGVDFAPLGVHLGSNLAAKIAPELPKSAQEPPKSRPRTAKSRPRQPRSSPGAAQDSPRASQKPTKMPKSSSGPAQDVPRTCSGAAQDLPEPLETQRITCDLTRNPSFTTQFFRTSFQATKRPKSKTSGGGTPPQGGLQSARPPWCVSGVLKMV